MEDSQCEEVSNHRLPDLLYPSKNLLMGIPGGLYMFMCGFRSALNMGMMGCNTFKDSFVSLEISPFPNA